MVVTFEKARVGVTTLHLSRVARATNVIRKFWPLGLDFENNPLKGDYFFEVLTKLPTHLLRTVSESQAEPGKLPRYFSYGLHIYSILTRYFAHLLHIFQAVWILHQCNFNTSAEIAPSRELIAV